jgi:branched-chain amino acid transport system substrate-binding protein
MTISRRQFVGGVAGAGIASIAAPNLVLGQNSEPIRIGLLAAKTGPLASGGIDMDLALTMFLKERENTFAGRKVELIVADTAGVPATARTKAQELIEKNNVHCMIGPLAAFEALAIADYLTEKEMPTLGLAAAENMTQRHPSPWFVRLTSTSAQCAYPLAEYSAKELKYKKIVTIADDFAYGHEMCAGFQRAFEDNGGKIIQKIFTPLATPDYGSYVGQVKSADAIFLGTAGSNGFRFLRQFIEYGLKDKMAVIGGMTALDESVLRNMGDEALGILTTSWYSAELDNPLNKSFAPAFRKQFKYDPGYYAASTYVAGEGGNPRQRRSDRTWSGQVRRIRQRDRECLYSQGRKSRRTPGEFRHQDLSGCHPVLDLRQDRIPAEPCLFTRLSTGKEPGTVISFSARGRNLATFKNEIDQRCSFGSSRDSTVYR